MTKQHFIQIAAMFRQSRPLMGEDVMSPRRHSTEEMREDVAHQKGRLEQWEVLVEDFAQLAARMNPRFDHARFVKACGRSK